MTSKAAVGFDATDQKFVVVKPTDLDADHTEGDAVDIDGRSLTLLQICESVDVARQAAEEKANNMLDINGLGLASITYDDEPQSSSSGTDQKEDEEEEEDDDDEMMEIQENGEILMNSAATNGVLNVDDEPTPYDMLDFSAANCLQQQMEHLRNSVRHIVAITMTDLRTDMDRLQQRYDDLARFFQSSFGTEADGRIAATPTASASSTAGKKFPTTFADSRGSRKSFSFGTIGTKKNNSENKILSYFDQVDEQLKRRLNSAVELSTRPTTTTTTTTSGSGINGVNGSVANGNSNNSNANNGNNNAARSWRTNGANTSAIRSTAQQENGAETEYSFGTPGTQGKRIVNGVVKTVDKLGYPFISQEEEEECLDQCQGVAPIYAQLLAKLLFADTIELYFKDQDTAKRNWLHDAVDYRFPTLDKPTHVSKWKNCSYFINKNMREAVQQSGNPMPRAPCGPRGPIGPKDKRKEGDGDDETSSAFNKLDKILKEVQPKSRLSEIKYQRKSSSSSSSTAAAATTPTATNGTSSRLISKPPTYYKYLPMSYEKECFEECRGEQYKYAELMALKLFADTLSLKFKEQDASKKEWLRHCVESRFPLEEGPKNDQRWKICGQTCNRNRTKVVGADGREEKHPYFPSKIEEECFQKSGGVASVYAELMNSRLFPDTQHLLFKDQDIGKRNWLHSILDKRFPTEDRMAHVSKWKTCTNAINKKLFDGTVTPITKEDVMIENGLLHRKEPSKSLECEGEEDEEEVEEEEEEEVEDAGEVDEQKQKQKALKTKMEQVEEEEKDNDKDSRLGEGEKEEEKEKEEMDVKPNLPKFERKIPDGVSFNGQGLKRKLEDETTATPSPAKRESIRNKIKKEKEYSERYTAYPYLSEEEEIEIFEAANGNPQIYGREIGRCLFKDSLKHYFKDQDPEKRQWLREIIDFRFPSKSGGEQKQKWKNVMAAINKNMTQVVVLNRRSVSK